MSKQISVLLQSPPDYPFFLTACLRNIRETIGIDIQEVDLVVLVSGAVCDATRESIHRSGLDARIINCPFTPFKGVHLKAIDWAMRHGSLQRWVYVQHSDMFWLEPGWGELKNCKVWFLYGVVGITELG